MEQCLEIRGLTKQYKGFALNNVTFSLPCGQILGLVGENGAGKSTTIKGILDLIRKDSGEVLFWGKSLAEAPAQKENIGVVLDEDSFHPSLTPQQVGNILRPAYRNWDDTLFQDYLTRFQLPADKPMKEFSKGMRRKLSIAAALSHRPRLLILDEPTNSLDPVMRDEILDVFLEFVQDAGNAILLSSHITTDLERVADHIVYLHQGEVLLSEPKDALLYQYGILRCGKADFEKLEKGELLTWRREEYRYSALVSDKETAKRKYKGLIVDDATLDEILLLYVKGERNG